MHTINTSGLRFIRLLMIHDVPELHEEIGEDLHTQEVWNVIKMIMIRIDQDDFLVDWCKQNGICKLRMTQGNWISDHRIFVSFDSEADYAIFKMSHGDLELDI